MKRSKYFEKLAFLEISAFFTGKPARQLRSAWTDEWERPDGPGILPTGNEGPPPPVAGQGGVPIMFNPRYELRP